MVAHGEVHEDQQEAQGPQEPLLQHRRLPILQRLLLGGVIHLLLGRALLPAAIARRLHGLNDGLGAGRALHAHGVGQEAHRAGGDPLHPVHGLLHPGAAGRAAHAGDVVLLHIRSSFCFCDMSIPREICPCQRDFTLDNRAAHPPYCKRRTERTDRQ